MPVPASITFKTVHIRITALDGSGTPAKGRVVFRSPVVVVDALDNFVFGHTRIVADLDASGEATVSLAATNDPDLNPTGWSWQAVVETDLFHRVFYMPVDAFGPTPIEFSDVISTIPVPPTGAGSFYTAPQTDALLAMKVDRAGDTVTGSLTIEDTLTAAYQGVTGDVVRFASTALSTGVTSGGNITINADPTKVDISATAGWVLDWDPHAALSATNPELTYVDYPGLAGVTPTYSPLTYWLTSSAGVLIQQGTAPTLIQSRTHLLVGVSYQSGGVVQLVNSLAVVHASLALNLRDLGFALGPFPTSGNRITPNGVNLRINTSGGSVFFLGAGTDYQDPNTAVIVAQTPATFRRATATTLLPTLVDTIDVANYDPNGAGTITALGGGVNTTAIHRVFAVPLPGATNQMAVQYGQSAYASLSAAVAAIGRGTFVLNPDIGGTLVGYICAIRTATNLSDPTQATFVPAGKFATP